MKETLGCELKISNFEFSSSIDLMLPWAWLDFGRIPRTV